MARRASHSIAGAVRAERWGVWRLLSMRNRAILRGRVDNAPVLRKRHLGAIPRPPRDVQWRPGDSLLREC